MYFIIILLFYDDCLKIYFITYKKKLFFLQILEIINIHKFIFFLYLIFIFKKILFF